MENLEILENLFEKSFFKEGLSKIEEFSKRKDIDFNEKTKINILKLRFLEKLGLYKQGLKLTNKLLSDKKITSNNMFEASILIEKAKILFSMGKRDEILHIIEVAEHKINIVHPQKITQNEILEKTSDILILRGGYYWQTGELDRALDYFNFNLKIRLKLNKNLDLAHAYNNIGVMHNAKGDLIKGLSYLKKAYGIYEIINYTRGISKTGNNIGAILIQLGELNNSLEYMTKSLEIDIRNNYTEGIQVASQNIGEVLWHKKEHKKAIKFLLKALEISEDLKDIFQISEILIPIIAVFIEMSDYKNANKYFAKLTQNKKRDKNKIILQRFLLAEAMILKSKGGFDNSKKAEDNLKAIIHDKIRYHDITVMALVNLCNILILKMYKIDDPTILNDLQYYVEKISQISKETNSHSIYIESLLIKAKISILNIEPDHYQDIMAQAQKIAQKFELYRINAKIDYEYNQSSEFLALIKNSEKMNVKSFKKNQLNLISDHIHSIFCPNYDIFQN
ncbi:tetratricopeptide repeat protein [Promethearchaeum syntrophicum]|uniref:Tetratricopeptide repeat protein n=1 Tax=Promethearchaeum syntrophicum TaxID=2594042 RepID=A0A5B9DFD7_9ARCH|nr:tetratricopeptide repeat protein [Candidatus Prometheoarchaeum syntrophicum]QEE17417.1 Tetratricopeptide repeat protein [Candidatus Prometheoarchaeum syntrophicum]